jgi:predicted nucleic acid-binding Zn ribbon protein
MKEVNKQPKKSCPVCAREYPEEDNYCGDDGTALKQARSTSGKRLSTSPKRD